MCPNTVVFMILVHFVRNIEKNENLYYNTGNSYKLKKMSPLSANGKHFAGGGKAGLVLEC